MLRHQKPLEILCVDVAVKLAHTPHLIGGLVEIPYTGLVVLDTKQTADVRPGEILNTRVQNLYIFKREIKVAKRVKVALIIVGSIFSDKFGREAAY